MTFSRRDFTRLLGSLPLAAPWMRIGAPARAGVRVRAITAGVTLRSLDDLEPVSSGLDFIADARKQFEHWEYEVQTTRIAVAWPGAPGSTLDPARFAPMDAMVAGKGAVLSIGPMNQAVASVEEAPDWVAELLRRTSRTSTSLTVARPSARPDGAAVSAAARTIRTLVTVEPKGLANFRFAAAANVPAGTPFFPVAWHDGSPAFAIGLESAGLVAASARGARGTDDARRQIAQALNGELSRVELIAGRLASGKWRYLGIDASPAPGPDRSIGEAIELVSGTSFGSPATLAACALVTEILRNLSVRTCGYSGLMLPVLEDRVLARRAAEKAYTVQDLLLFSSVCGTGVDVVPAAGDAAEEDLRAIIGDMAALSAKWQKPLSARILPVPGVAVGEPVRFDDPVLTDSAAMPLR